MTAANVALVNAIRSRSEKQTEFNYGIITADRYLTTLQDCAGSDLCYRYASTKSSSFNDLLKKASTTLTYNNEDMVTEDIYVDWKARMPKEYPDFELPKNTLMVFEHILTTPRKDRDGDILRTQGARPDPKMLLLWQHVHTLPIGKMLAVTSHTSKHLKVVTAIIDLNELAHDAAVMVDNDMGRFSHGFKALDFSKMKEEQGKPTGGGFDVKEFEIMEESLVSVPANVDADTQEILIDLIERDKLSSSMMKSFGKRLRAMSTKVSSAGGLDVNLNITVKGNDVKVEASDEIVKGTDEILATKSGTCGCGAGPGETCGCGAGKSTPKKEDDKAEGEDSADDKKMMHCPKCGDMAYSDGKCSKCGYVGQETEKEPEEGKSFIGEFAISGSWEESQLQLNAGLKNYFHDRGIDYENNQMCIISTMKDYGIVCVNDDNTKRFFKIGWETKRGAATWDGVFSEVEVKMPDDVDLTIDQVLNEKAGRVLNKSNRQRLVEVSEDLKEIHSITNTRSGKVLADRCHKTVIEVIKSSGSDDDDGGKSVKIKPVAELDANQASSRFLKVATPDQIGALEKVLATLREVDDMKKDTRKLKSVSFN
jgi:ribosomal protein L32